MLLFKASFQLLILYILKGKSLLQRYRAAISDRNTMKEAHRGFSANFKPRIVAEWQSICAAWDLDGFPKTLTNPFKVDDTSELYVHFHVLICLKNNVRCQRE